MGCDWLQDGKFLVGSALDPAGLADPGQSATGVIECDEQEGERRRARIEQGNLSRHWDAELLGAKLNVLGR